MPITWDQPQQTKPSGIVWDQQPKPEGLAADSGHTPDLGSTMQHVGGAVMSGANTLGRVLDAQRWKLAQTVSGKSSTDDQMTALRQHIPAWMAGLANVKNPDTGKNFQTLDEMYQYQRAHPVIIHGNQVGQGHAPDIDLTHLGLGAIDTGLQTFTDPLTYETFGLAPLARGAMATSKAIGLTPKILEGLNTLHATPFGQRLASITQKAHQEVGQPIFDTIHDWAHWGGELKRKHGAPNWNMVRGAANFSSASGMRVQQHLVNRFNTIVGKLNDQEVVKVGRALNGEIPGQVAEHPMLDRESGAPDIEPEANPDALTPKEYSAYRQLRVLTELDYEMRVRAAREVAFQTHSQGLSVADRDVLKQALDKGKRPDIPEPVQVPGKNRWSIKQIDPRATDTSARSRAINLPARIVSQTPKLSERYMFKPKNWQEIEHAEMLAKKYDEITNLVAGNTPKRENYMPWAHEGDVSSPERQHVTGDYHDPRFQERENVQVTTPDQIRRGFEAMASNTGNRVADASIRDALGELWHDPSVQKALTKTIKATGSYRTNTDKIREAWLSAIGYPRAAVVSITPRHAANILDLVANTVSPERLPQVMKDTMALAARLVKANPKEYAKLTQEGRQLGALSGAFTERKPFFQAIPGVRNWTAFNNKLVWAIDEAAKQTYAKLLLETGEATHPLEAGGMASSRLVDYEHVAPMVQKFMRYVAPFGTFRGSIPGAVAGGIARNPARAALYNRMTGGAMYGGKGDQQGGITMYNPTADVGRMLDQPTGRDAIDRLETSGLMNYARGSAGAPIQAAANLGQDVLTGFDQGRGSHFASYGQPWLPRRMKNGQLDLGFIASSALAGIPEAQTILDSMGISRYKWRGLAKELARQTVGIGLP